MASNGYGAFFVSKLLVFLSEPQQSDLLLSSISVDAYAVTLSSQSYGPQAPKVVVVASGNTMGEVVASLPSYLSPLLVKDPLGNVAIVLNGVGGNGLKVGLMFASQGVGIAGTLGAEAIVTAPTNDTITISLS